MPQQQDPLSLGLPAEAPAPGTPRRRNPRRNPRRTQTPTPKKPEAGLKQFDLVEFNRQAESAFRELLTGMLGWTVVDIIAEAAWQLDISTETARRYLMKYTAKSAPWRIVDGTLRRPSPG